MGYALKEEEKSLEYLMLEFIETYQKNHSKEEVLRLGKKILYQKDINDLPESLKAFEKGELSREFERLIIEHANDKEYKMYHLEKFLPIFMPIGKESTSYRVKKVAITGAIIAVTGVSGLFIGSNGKSNKDTNQPKVTTQTTSTTSVTTDKESSIEETPTKEEVSINEEVSTNEKSIEELQKKKEELLKAKKKQEEKEKHEVLTTFSKCKNVKKIQLREEELKNLKLKKSDKIYKDCPLSAELQHFIYEQSIINKLPVDFMFSIIDVETRGQFNSSGSESYNRGNNTYDLGLTQQNSKEPLISFCRAYHIDYDSAYELLKNDDFVNVSSAFLEVKEIQSRINVYDPYEYAGCYNGWLNWREKDISLQYVELFRHAYNDIYTKHHHIETKKVLTNSKKK